MFCLLCSFYNGNDLYRKIELLGRLLLQGPVCSKIPKDLHFVLQGRVTEPGMGQAEAGSYFQVSLVGITVQTLGPPAAACPGGHHRDILYAIMLVPIG